MIKTLGGHEVEIIAARMNGEGKNAVQELDLRRVSDGYIYRNWQRWGLKADGGRREIDAAVARVEEK